MLVFGHESYIPIDHITYQCRKKKIDSTHAIAKISNASLSGIANVLAQQEILTRSTEKIDKKHKITGYNA